jgi:cytochrome c-type biogenesis protein CcmH/NrfF
MAIGTGIALLPERALSFALNKLPAEGATTTVALLLLLLVSGRTVVAQSSTTPQHVASAVLKPLERHMQSEIICMCGGCRSPIDDCPMLYCHSRDPQKAMLHDLVEQGQTQDQIVAAFIKKYGGEDVLGAPLDQGFNRLAWLFPYLVGAGSAVGVGFVAARMSRRRPASDGSDARDLQDTKLDDRLDDELRNLD